MDRPEMGGLLGWPTCVGLIIVLRLGGCSGGITLLGDGDLDANVALDAETEGDAADGVGADADVDGGVHADGDAGGEADADAEVVGDAAPDTPAEVGADGDVTGDADAMSDAAADVPTCDEAWRDPTTGYLWEYPPSDTTLYWGDAVAYCDALRLCGYDAGSWHLPDIDELRSLIRECPDTATGGPCGVTASCLDWEACRSDSCNGCPWPLGPSAGGCYLDPVLNDLCIDDGWWSSSSIDGTGSDLWTVSFYFGNLWLGLDAYPGPTLCVHREP